MSRQSALPLKLHPLLASMDAHLFENVTTGLARALYWSLRVEMAPIEVEGKTWSPSFAVEWLNVPAPSAPHGVRWQASAKTASASEATVYVFSHERIDDWALKVQHTATGREAKLAFRGTVDAYSSEKWDVACEGTVPLAFEGLIVVPGNLPEVPGTEAEARAALAPFIDHSAYDATDEDWRFVFVPKGAPDG